jgi:hypothetical protein
MTRKTIIVFVLTAGMVAGALVFDGVSHRHTESSGQSIPQNPVTAPAGDSSNSSNPQTAVQTEAQTDLQQDATAPDDASATEAGQDAASGDDPAAQTSADEPNADAPDSDASQPAAQPVVVPAGTMLTVRLGEALGSRISEANQSFSATLDQDVVVGGQTVIAAGARVTGKVVAAKPAGALAGEANLQLKLISVNADKAHLRLATSVRSFGPKIKGKNKVGRFMKGLAKRASGDEREVLLAEQSAYSFTLQRGLQIE